MACPPGSLAFRDSLEAYRDLERRSVVSSEAIVIAAIGEPGHLLPPLVWETVGRDIMDLSFERLAVLEGGRPTMDTDAYRPALASRWERVDGEVDRSAIDFVSVGIEDDEEDSRIGEGLGLRLRKA